MKKDLESSQVAFYLSGMKNIKVADPVHKELKIFSANHPDENMSEVAGFSIMKYLKERKHKFSTPLEKISHKIKSQSK